MRLVIVHIKLKEASMQSLDLQVNLFQILLFYLKKYNTYTPTQECGITKITV